jgi:hypothetical protein
VCIYQKQPKALFILGKEFIPTAKQITDLREDIFQRKKQAIRDQQKEKAMKQLVNVWDIEPKYLPGTPGYGSLWGDPNNYTYVKYIDLLFAAESFILLDRHGDERRREEITKEYYF